MNIYLNSPLPITRDGARRAGEGLICCFLLFIISSITLATPSTEFIEGKHYLRFTDKIANNHQVLKLKAKDPNDAQVLEFFSYGCFWCWQLRPHMAAWAKQQATNVSLYRVPIAFHSGSKVLAKAYYLVEMLAITEQLDQALFQAAHQRESNIAKRKNLLKFLTKNGIAADKVNAMYNSFSMQQKILFSNAIAKAYRIIETPRIIINTTQGSYVTNINLAGSKESVAKVIDFLIAKDAVKHSKN